MENNILQSPGVDLVNFNVYAKFHQIFHKIQEIGPVTRFRIWTSAKPRPLKNDIWQSLGIDLVYINVYAKFYQTFKFYVSRAMGPVSLFQNLDLGNASTDDKWHSAIPFVRSCQYQCVFKIVSNYYLWFKDHGQLSLF